MTTREGRSEPGPLDAITLASVYSAAMRARESERPDHLFTDPYAAELVGEQVLDALDLEPRAVRHAALAIRTRFFDGRLERILREPGPAQLVVLASGLDTRAFRLPLPPELALFELDRSVVLAIKTRRLARRGAVPRCRWYPIPADLDGDWAESLLDGGFDPGRPAIWLMEGVLSLLTESQVQEMLRTLSGLAATGSWLLADVLSRSFLASRRLRPLQAASGVAFRYGTDDPASLVREHGWQPHVTLYGGPGADFGRWQLPQRDAARRSSVGYLITAWR